MNKRLSWPEWQGTGSRSVSLFGLLFLEDANALSYSTRKAPLTTVYEHVHR